MNSIKEREYIAGFDIIKLFGCFIVAFFHSIFMAGYATSGIVKYPQLFAYLIAVYYIMAGYLLAGSLERSKRPNLYTLKYIVKYSAFYFITAFIWFFMFFIDSWSWQGIYMFYDIVYYTLIMPFVYVSFAPQHLWFIPPLIIGVAINSIIINTKKQKIFYPIVLVITIMISIISMFDGVISEVAPNLFANSIFMNVLSFMSKTIEGIFCVGCGTIIYKHREKFMSTKTWWMWITLCLFAVAEILVYYAIPKHYSEIRILPLSMFAIAVLLIKLILKIKMPTLKKYHTGIILFSGIMYFLHTVEMLFLNSFIENGIVCFVIYTVFNIILASIICKIIKINKSKKIRAEKENEIYRQIKQA